MRTALLLLLALFFVPPASAQGTPEATVEQFYRDWLAWHSGQGQPREDWVAQHRSLLTPSLYKPLHKALSIHPKYGLPPIDFDPFTSSQVSFVSYQVGQAKLEGDTATVPVAMRLQTRVSEPGTVHYRKMRLERTGGEWQISDIVYREGSQLSSVLESLRDWKPVKPRVTNQEAVQRLFDGWLAENRKGQPTPGMTIAFLERHRDLLAPETADLLLEALRTSPPLDRNLFCNGSYRMVSYQLGTSYGGESFSVQVRREGKDGQSHVQGLMVDAADGRVTNVIYGLPDANMLEVCRKHLDLARAHP